MMALHGPATRSANACEQCRRRKVKCSGNQPCRTCVRQKTQCSFPSSGRGRYSDAYVQGLLATIRSHEEHSRGSGSADTSFTKAQSQPAIISPASAVVHASGVSPASSAPTERATGPAFEQRVRKLLQQRHPEPSSKASLSPFDENVESGKAVPTTASIVASTVTELLQKTPRPELPSESESHKLLALFLNWLGVNQHFFDPRSFVDTMTLLFLNETSRQQTIKSLWFVQYLLVMAMGKLMDYDTPIRTLHGLDYFAEAMDRMPPMHRIQDSGVIGVEILALVALNLQWRERKYEAYFHLGVAVRLALTLGCALPYKDQGPALPSEKAHRNRVWWTVFMLDRRLSADLGLPSAVDDRQLSTELPRESPGFPSPGAIINNIKIARTTGGIMTSLYGNNSLSQYDLVENIQTILSTLFDIGQSIPIEYSTDLNRTETAMNRTGGSLYLMLFQAIILCTRPIVLQRVKEKATAFHAGEHVETSPVIDRFCSTCKESAIKSIRVLHGLSTKRQIARFGFFDLDATFSASLILVMVGFVDGIKQLSELPTEFGQAINILQDLSNVGNKAAESKLEDIRQFCSFIWPSGVLPDLNSAAELVRNEKPSCPHSTDDSQPSRSVERAGESSAEAAAAARPVWTGGQHRNDDNVAEGASPAREGLLHAHDQVSTEYLVDFERGYDYMDLNTDADGIFLSFNDPNLPLTGVDQLDWAEMEKVFAGRTS